MPEVQPDIFRVYARWVHYRDIIFRALDAAEGRKAGQSLLLHEHLEQLKWMKLYVFTDYIGDMRFMNEISTRIGKRLSFWKRGLRVETYRYVWSNTVDDAPLRRLLRDIVIARMDRNSFAQHVKEMPIELLEEIAVASLRARPLQDKACTQRSITYYLEVEEKAVLMRLLQSNVKRMCLV